jgi:hypothetical protein
MFHEWFRSRNEQFDCLIIIYLYIAKSTSMKSIFAAVLLMACSLPLFSQKIEPGTYSRRDDYLLKSQRRQRAGIILVSAGAIVTAGSTLLIIDGVNRNQRDDYGNNELNGGDAEIVIGVLGTFIGVGSMGASIPFFVGAHRSRKKALGISFKAETAPLYFKTAIARQAFPALAFRIPLGK